MSIGTRLDDKLHLTEATFHLEGALFNSVFLVWRCTFLFLWSALDSYEVEVNSEQLLERKGFYVHFRA